MLLDTAPDVAHAQQLLDQDRRRTRRALTRQYSLSRNADIDDLHEKMLQEVRARQDTFRAQVLDQIRQRFGQYADERAPIVTQIASLDAYVPFVRGSAAGQQYKDRSSKLKTQLNALDADYLQDRRNIQARVRTQNDVELANAAREVATLRAQADEDAVVSAEKHMREARHAVPRPTLQRVQLAGVPARTVTVAGSATPPAAPRLQKSEPVDASNDRRDLVARQLKVWAATNGYSLEKGGRDATDEFIEWMKVRRLGR